VASERRVQPTDGQATGERQINRYGSRITCVRTNSGLHSSGRPTSGSSAPNTVARRIRPSWVDIPSAERVATGCRTCRAK